MRLFFHSLKLAVTTTLIAIVFFLRPSEATQKISGAEFVKSQWTHCLSVLQKARSSLKGPELEDLGEASQADAQNDLYLWSRDPKSSPTALELSSAKYFSSWLKSVDSHLKILLVPKIGADIPAFDGVLFSESGSPLANLSIKSFEPTPFFGNEDDEEGLVGYLAGGAAEKIRTYTLTDAWKSFFKDPSLVFEARSDQVGIDPPTDFRLPATHLFPEGMLFWPYAESPAPQHQNRWAQIQWLRTVTRLFGIPYSVSQRPTWVLVDLRNHNENRDARMHPDLFTKTQKRVQKSKGSIEKFVFLGFKKAVEVTAQEIRTSDISLYHD